MSNIIAVIWDCDKTLINGYMQDPILKNMVLMLRNFGRKIIKNKMIYVRNILIYALILIHII